ncbi:PucR family transcriptional regulator [Anoxybacteroides tepidamans]|uniref:PucR family transcriptional regulator n=1 Tax=Anoxybacteroides tepidamans TaxID=265948 RepID=UPI000B2C1686|nr:helix-turn-helix domain-containing protein [Anoxybacillus tepidamans]
MLLSEKEFLSLHELADFVSAYVQCPVTIESRDLELLAYSGNHNDPDAVRMTTILSKRASANVVHYLHEKGWIQRIEEANGVIEIPALPDIGLGPRTVACIKSGKRIYGYLWVQETNNEFDEKHEQFLLLAAKKAAELLDKQLKGSYKRQEEMNQIIMSLIQQDDQNERDIKMEVELRGMKLPSSFAIAVFRILRADKKEMIRHYITFAAKSLSESVFFIESNDPWIVVIGNSSSVQRTATEQAKMLLSRLEHDFRCDLQHDVMVGIGNEYRSLLKIRQSYVEAVEVVNIKKQIPERIGHFYKDLGIYRLLPSIHEQYKRQRYKNEQLLKLAKYDEENQTQLLETLKQYIKNDCKIKETAECLYVHPNTLHYRIKRIQSITDIDFDNFEQRMMLYIDLLLFQYKD